MPNPSRLSPALRFIAACLAGVFGALILFLIISNAVIVWRSKPHIFRSVETVPERATVIVLGARVYASGNLSPMLGDRMRTALEAYRQGKASRFLLSADHGQTQYDEVNAMKDFLLKEGVAREDIFLDHAGFDTYDSMYRAKAIFEVESAIVVTQEFHMPRAVYLAKRMGIDAVGLVADRQPYAGIAYNKAREIPARAKAFLHATLRVKPKFLGEPIPITGDALKSWDTF